MSDKLSVLIPNRNCQFLTKTIEDILNKSAGEIEVIINVDENPPDRIVNDKRVTYLFPQHPLGMRGGINACNAKATGKYIMKTDDHCMFDEGFDEVLKADCDEHWIVIPRRHSLDAENWKKAENGKSGRDYHYICYPDPFKGHDKGFHGMEWPERSRERANKAEYLIDDTPSFQGSCWFMHKSHFDNVLQGMHEEGYGIFAQEPEEIGFKTWLSGGAVKVNKKTSYYHLHKGKTYGRMYRISQQEIIDGHNYSAWYWMNNSWEGQIHPFSWYIQKFMPMPTWDSKWNTDWDKMFIEWRKQWELSNTL